MIIEANLSNTAIGARKIAENNIKSFHLRINNIAAFLKNTPKKRPLSFHNSSLFII